MALVSLAVSWLTTGTTSGERVSALVVPFSKVAVSLPSQRLSWMHKAPRVSSKEWFSW
jgi:hypothetical protein